MSKEKRLAWMRAALDIIENVFKTMPDPLRKKVFTQVCSAICVFGVTVLAIVYTNDMMCCVGFLLSLVVLYIGLDIVWKWSERKIEYFRARVYKAKTHGNGMVRIMVRDATISDADIPTTDFQTFTYSIPVTRKMKGLITEGTILDIYLNPANPNVVITYEIIG